MNPVTHGLVSWVAAAAPREMSMRDRGLVLAAGVAADVDGAGILVELFTRGTEHELLWWSRFHHQLHTLGFALLVTAVVVLFARRKVLAGALALGVFHIHLFCDLIGARGPDGYQWPIPYLEPFSGVWQLEWAGQWGLNAWPNFVITGVALVATLVIVVRRGYSPIGIFSSKVDARFVETLRKRFGLKQRSCEAEAE